MASDESLAVSGRMGENGWWVDLGSRLLGIAWIWKRGGARSNGMKLWAEVSPPLSCSMLADCIV